MSDLFDLPFEDDPQAPEAASPEPTAPPPPLATMPASSGGRVGSAEGAKAGGARHVFTVTELTVRVRDLLEEQFFEIWVEGELSNCKVWNTGHLYFSLKDASSQLRGFMFRSSLRYLKFKPGDGLRVIARGKLSVYEPKGEYQFVCEHLEPHGLGARQLAFDQLKQRLQQEGLFDAARKRPLPALPRKIGIVTSLDGAAIRDIIKVLRRRYANVHLVISPARVQGEDAAPEIARSLRQIARVPGVDVVIVARGGGSLEDLWAFNEESVARAIARVPVPVISAVGHETDVTIADFVADMRAPTPSAAAELVVAAKMEFSDRIDRLRDRLGAGARGHLQRLSRRIHVAAGRPAFAGFPTRLAMRGRHAAELSHVLARLMRAGIAVRERRCQQLDRQLATFDLGRRLEGIRTRLVGADGRLSAAARRRQHRAGAQLGHVAGRLEALNPLAVLGRGYAVAWNEDKSRVLRDVSSVTRGDIVKVTLANGELDCEVRSTAESTPWTPRTQR